MRSAASWLVVLGMLLALPATAQEEAADPFGGPDPFSGAPSQTALTTPDANRTHPEAPLCYWAEADAEANERIRKILRQPLSSIGVDFQETPLEEVVEFLKDEYDFEIQIDARALDEMGIQPDVPVSVNIRNVSLASALGLMLKQHELAYMVCGGMLVVTPEEEVQCRRPVVAVYPIGNLLGGEDAKNQAASEKILETIKATVAADTWAPDGGVASIKLLPGSLLVISQTEDVHEEIHLLLRAIELAREHAE